MKTLNIFTDELDSLPEGKADFLLAASLSNRCEIETIAPCIDAELISDEKVHSVTELSDILNEHIPALITRAVHNLNAFSSIEILNLGLESSPQNSTLHNFDIMASGSISDGVNIDAKEVFLKGMDFGKSYELKGSYLILGESIPCGTTTAYASALALGYDLKDDFSSSFLELPNNLKEMSNFEKLSLVSDNMLLFCAGFILEASRRFHVVLAGGTQMAACLLIADAIREDLLMRVKSDNISFATTSWLVNDKNSNISNILSKLSYKPHAMYTTFSFENAEIPVLKKYNGGEVKDGVGAGATLAYATQNNIENDEILQNIEFMMYSI